MSTVSTAEMMPKYSSPKTLTASAPTPAAPIVWAMVFSERIAEMGLSISCFCRMSSGAYLAPSCSFMAMNDMGVESRTASRIEQRNEMASATER